jgi:hypothetical protein
VRKVLAALTVVFTAIAFTGGIAGAEDTTGGATQPLQQIIDVRDVRAEPDQVSGVLVNLSSKVVHDVRVRIDRAWLWADERAAGGTAESPARTAAYTVPGEIAPGGRLPFTYRSATPLPERSDGRFETSVSVIGLEQVAVAPRAAP